MSTDMDAETLRGVITRVYHASPRWSAGQLRTDTGATEKFAGNFYAVIGDRVLLRGEWSDDPKWGYQFKVDELAFEEQVDAAGLANWLSSHEAAAGIGSAKAKRLVDQFGSEFEWTLLNDPEKIARAANIPIENVKHLSDEWQKQREFNTIATHLAAWDLTAHQCRLLADKFGASIIRLLDQDPYLLIGEVSGLGFRRVDDIAQKRGMPKEHPGRIRAALLYALTISASICARRRIYRCNVTSSSDAANLPTSSASTSARNSSMKSRTDSASRSTLAKSSGSGSLGWFGSHWIS